MAQRLFSLRFAAAGAFVALFAGMPAVDAQIVRGPLTEGFARTSSIAMSVDEMLGTSKVRALDEPIVGPGFPSLWIAEVQFKPVRLMRLELPDPKTGKIQKELVRYMVYRAIRRDYTELAGKDRADLVKKLADPETAPSNVLDEETVIPLQMPRFLLQTEDIDGTVIDTYTDEISIDIQNAVFRREMGRRGANLRLLNSIEAISEIGDPVPSAAVASAEAGAAAAAAGGDKEAVAKAEKTAADVANDDALTKAVYGVAVWRNVDPKADFLSVTMSGFCNAYRISGATPETRLVEEKVIVQKFARPGDEFLQEEMEFRLIDEVDSDGDGKVDTRYPLWQYRPKAVQLNIQDLDTVLRNARRDSAQPAGR